METAEQAGGEAEITVREPTLRIGKYAITDTLGKGASGTVYRALDTFSGQEVALKVLDERFFAGQGIDEGSRQQFMNEASLAGQLQHPHIAAILEASIEEKSGYIALEYVPGGTLASAIRSGKPPKLAEVIEIAFKCCGALDYAHRLGIIHRDIKPANLMIAEGTQVKIVDFGAAQVTLGDAEIWELVHASHWVRVPAQTTLMREGDKGSELLFLANGEVKVVKHGRLLNVLRTGSYFGEMAYVKGGRMPRQATVETLTEALIAEFRPAALRKLSERCQLQLSVSLLNTVVDRLAFADERIAHA